MTMTRMKMKIMKIRIMTMMMTIVMLLNSIVDPEKIFALPPQFFFFAKDILAKKTIKDKDTLYKIRYK